MKLFLRQTPPRRETWTHLALAAAIWWVLYQVTPDGFTHTEGPASIITMTFLALVALAFSIMLWMISPEPVRRAMLHLRWIVPIGFFALAHLEKQRIETEGAAEMARLRALSAAQTTTLPVAAEPAPVVVVGEPEEESKPSVPSQVDRIVSLKLPATLAEQQTLSVQYRWEDEGRQLRFPIRLKSGSTPEAISRVVQSALDSRDIPLWVYIDEAGRLCVESRYRASTDRWIITSEPASVGIVFSEAG